MEEALPMISESFRGRANSNSLLFGTPEVIRQKLQAYEEAGVQELTMSFFPRHDPDQLRRFAGEFIA